MYKNKYFLPSTSSWLDVQHKIRLSLQVVNKYFVDMTEMIKICPQVYYNQRIFFAQVLCLTLDNVQKNFIDCYYTSSESNI